MPNTAVHLSTDQIENLVTPYRKEDRSVETKAFVMGKLTAAGGVYSNIRDLSNLMIAQIIDYNKKLLIKKFDSPLILTENSGIKGDDYGFGLSKKVFETGTQYGHGGDLDGFASAYIFSPEHDSGIIILTSSGGNWVGELEKELFYKLTNRKYVPHQKSIARTMSNVIMSIGIKKSLQWFEREKNKAKYFEVNENEINDLGYELLKKGYVSEAVEIFKLNTTLFPLSSNVYDSLAETYLKIGNKKAAIINYKKSLALDSENTETIRKLEKIDTY